VSKKYEFTICLHFKNRVSCCLRKDPRRVTVVAGSMKNPGQQGTKTLNLVSRHTTSSYLLPACAAQKSYALSNNYNLVNFLKKILGYKRYRAGRL
jgi:hypothetical protein